VVTSPRPSLRPPAEDGHSGGTPATEARLGAEGSPDEVPRSAPAPSVRRNKALAIGLAAIIVAAAIGWYAGRRIQSPAEVAARTAPPALSVISVPVEQQALTSDVVVRGTVRYGSPRAVTLPLSPLKPAVGVVTSAPAQGVTLDEGSVALTVSGRPVVVLQGDQPAYRDLGPGTEGADVRQLEEALARLGFDPGASDGRYDRRTEAAVSRWYRSMGWAPFGPTDDQQSALRSLQADEFGVQSERLNAEESLATARSDQAAANADVAVKTAALNEAIAAQEPGAVDAAYAELVAANTAAGQAALNVGVAERRLSLATRREGAVGSETGSAAAKLGIQVPADEVLFFPTLPLRVDEVTIKNGEETSVPVMTVSNSQLVVDAALTPADAKLVNKGAEVAIEEPEQAIRLAGSVSDVAGAPGTQGADPGRFYLGVTPANAPATLVGSSVVLTITVSTTKGEVLVVPIAALSVAADGSSRVQVRSGQRSTRYVTVRPGLAAKGLVAVTPVKGRLARGDLVVVGKNAGGVIPGSTPATKSST
jgi:peptidoglycan hydrolase-like protein with peptidoglycan-binding domain